MRGSCFQNSIDFQKNNFAALSVGNGRKRPIPSLLPCEINFLKIYTRLFDDKDEDIDQIESRSCFRRIIFDVFHDAAFRMSYSFPDKDFGCVIGWGWPRKKAYPLPAAFPKSLSEKLYMSFMVKN